ncbi:zinc-ribbon domain-containing protein [Bifidobacterium sp. SMB2]|uniref:Zinc-ribbon domain-containing protein n=1 Tax=Bifidobacterium saimiriisciurei TaxID=2661627 RepID=A0ABX0CB43_9BIFI|nr:MULTISPECIES: zinc ribbon domain-containing protein [Bifidobacterium]NEG96664.1 zinc-ribbon domain-containing protein [Bifidobacterium sp. SMB2]NEH11820.1 zinc-ribbon domain-containing protein [Bifidobacterium saimiriisciurei]
MFCHKCGARIPDDSLFCPKCGAKLASSAEKTEARDSADALVVDQRQSDGAEEFVVESDGEKDKDGRGIVDESARNATRNADAEEPHWWNRSDEQANQAAEAAREQRMAQQERKWHRRRVIVITVVALIVIAVIVGAVLSSRSTTQPNKSQESSEVSNSGNGSDGFKDSDDTSADSTGESTDQASSQSDDQGLRDLAACGRPGYFVLTTGDAGKPVARLENTGTVYTSMNEYVDLRCLAQKLGYTGTDLYRELGDNESWNDSMNWQYATEGDAEFNDDDDSAYRKEYSTPKRIGDDTYRVKCFDENHRSICDFYMTGNTPTPAEMMKAQYKGNSNAVGYDQYKSYNCLAGNSGQLTPCSSVYQEMENGTMQYLPFGIENASDPDDYSTYIPVDTNKNGVIDDGEMGD